jgi:hypothetical protein
MKQDLFSLIFLYQKNSVECGTASVLKPQAQYFLKYYYFFNFTKTAELPGIIKNIEIVKNIEII